MPDTPAQLGQRRVALFVGKHGYLGAKGSPIVRATYELVSDHPNAAAAMRELARLESQPYFDDLDAARAENVA